MHELTEENRRNLDRLATKLESLPKEYKHFDMAVFADAPLVGRRKEEFVSEKDQLRAQIAQYALNNGGVDSIGADLKCGSVACAVGHGPSAGILVPANMVHDDYVDWHVYAQLFTGVESYDPDAFTDTRREPFFQWMFGGDWDSYDNTHYGAAARIRYILEHGSPPDVFIEEGDTEDYGDYMDYYAEYRITEPKPLPAGFYPELTIA